MTDDFKGKKDEVVNGIILDIRVGTKIRAYLKNKTEVSDSAENRAAKYTEAYAQVFKTVDSVVMEKLYQDSGYEQQWKNDMAVNMLIQIFCCADQRLNQQRSQYQLDKLRSRDKSKTAIRDLQKRREQQGYWEPEW